MGIPAPILNAGFMQFGLSAFTMHDALFPPPIKAPVPGLVEGPAFMGWPAGIIAHKRDLTVLVDGNPGIQHGHDAGYLIPHLAAPVNSYMAVNTAFSKHKVPFPVSSVKIGASAAGTYLFVLFGIICAQPVSLPTGVLIILRCTVVTGLTPLDIVKGFLTIAIDVAFDWLWKKFTGTALGKRVVKKPFKELALPKWVGSATIEALGGAALVIRETGGRAVNKAIDHLLKSFVASPALTGLPFGKIGIGRGSWGPGFKFFSW